MFYTSLNTLRNIALFRILYEEMEQEINALDVAPNIKSKIAPDYQGTTAQVDFISYVTLEGKRMLNGDRSWIGPQVDMAEEAKDAFDEPTARDIVRRAVKNKIIAPLVEKLRKWGYMDLKVRLCRWDT